MSFTVPFESQVPVPATQTAAKPVIDRRTHRRAIALAVLAAIGFGIGGLNSARADLITPAGLAPGTTFRYIYVTTATTDGAATDNATYNTIVTNDASSQGYSTYNGATVAWTALVSTSTTSAKSLVNDNVAFYLPDGTEVAASTAALFNTANVPLLEPVGPDAENYILTGSTNTGDIAAGFYVGSMAGTEDGDPYATTVTSIPGFGDDGWLDTSIHNGSGTPIVENLYAFSSEITVPSPVPEPASLGLLAAAAVPLLMGRKRHSH